MSAGLTRLEPIAGTARALLDACPLGLVILDRDFRVHYFNASARKLSGRAGADSTGTHIVETLGHDGWAALKPLVDRAMKGEQVATHGWVEYQGGRRYVARYYSPIRSEGGAVLGCFGFVQDMTQQVEFERKAAEIEHMKSAMVDAALDCIVAIDETGAIIEFNPSSEKTFGRKRAEVLGKQISEVLIPPAHRAAHAQGFARFLKTGKGNILGRRVEIEALRADGKEIPVELTLAELRYDDKRIFTAHLRDLSQRKAAEAEIARQRDALQHAQTLSAMGSLLASVAHELNNPLAIVLGQATMLAEETKSGPMRRRVQRVHEAAERSAAIVRTFLGIARQRPPVRRRTDMGEVCRAAARLLEYGLKADGIALTIAVAPRTPPIQGDPDQLHQVVANLIVNAQHALRGTSGKRRIAIATAPGKDGQVVTTIDDSGPGVAPEIKDKIFEAFFTTKSTGQGTGIGLPVSRNIVTGHGGSIACEDSKLGGARFVVRLPQAPAGTEKAKPKAKFKKPAKAARRALVVDDEPEIAGLLAEIVAGQGWAVDMAGNGKEAIKKLAKGRYDAVFSDLRMPGLDGHGLADWMDANRPELADRLVFVTGDFASVAGAKHRKAAVLEKPFGPAEVRRVLADLAAAKAKPARR